jgi:hypothetical protein
MPALTTDLARVLRLPVNRLRTSFASLRSHVVSTTTGEPLADLPLRVVAQDDGCFEVIDGFKRLARSLREGASEVAAVLESASSPMHSKALLLRANAPPRTLTAMDEARVIDSLVREDGLTLAAAARLLGRRKAWAARRHALATRLAPAAQGRLDEGRIGPSLAYALSALPGKDQETVLDTLLRHRLKQRESLTLVAAWRAAGSERERSALVRDPLGTVRPQPDGPSPVGPLATRLEERISRLQQALLELSTFALPPSGLTDAERRRLEAQHHALLDQLGATARALLSPTTSDPMEDLDDRRPQDPSRLPRDRAVSLAGGAPPDPASPRTRLRDPRDRPPRPAQPQARPPGPARGGPRPLTLDASLGGKQARPVP